MALDRFVLCKYLTAALILERSAYCMILVGSKAVGFLQVDNRTADLPEVDSTAVPG